MELNIDTGVEEFRVNGRGVLRFNPADPNLYHRFFAAGAELDGYDAALTKALAALDGDEQQRAAAGLALLNEYDGKIKKLLTGIFGAENDFDAILGGVNLAGVGANGKRVVQNLLEALTPILREGGFICFEFGMGQEASVCQILMDHGYRLGRLVRDSGERARAVMAQKPVDITGKECAEDGEETSGV